MVNNIKQKNEIPLNDDSFLSKSPGANLEKTKNFEKRESFENSNEKDLEKLRKINDEGELGLGSVSGTSSLSSKEKDVEKKIEKILEKDMDDIYLGLSEEKKREFKSVGEKTAKQINFMIQKGKLKFKKVIILIKKWLLVVPGINKFFLEQEAKLKADEIMKLKS